MWIFESYNVLSQSFRKPVDLSIVWYGVYKKKWLIRSAEQHLTLMRKKEIKSKKASQVDIESLSIWDGVFFHREEPFTDSHRSDGFQ